MGICSINSYFRQKRFHGVDEESVFPKMHVLHGTVQLLSNFPTALQSAKILGSVSFFVKKCMAPSPLQ